jgi:hypothetical protein
MTTDNFRIERAGQILFVKSGEPMSIGSQAVIGFVAFIWTGLPAIAALTKRSITPLMPENASVLVAMLFVFSIFSVHASRQWTTEVNTESRTLKIFRRPFGLWEKTILNCRFEDCSALGIIECETEGVFSYEVYIQYKFGEQHLMPLKNSTYEAAARIAMQLSVATGIPRLDTKY